MFYYEDLKRSNNKASFIMNAVDNYTYSTEYRIAKDAELYYAKHNVTIENFQKYLYTLRGKAIPDTMSANYKIKTNMFNRIVTTLTQYILGNGINIDNKEIFGKHFDYELQAACKRALVDGVSFLFWNVDHIETFATAETRTSPGFCPLYDLRTGELRAGIRFWTRVIGDHTIRYYTLYEEDGYTEYISTDRQTPKETEEKRAYVLTVTSLTDGSVVEVSGVNYNRLPIIPMWGNDLKQSELQGIREAIDAYDLIKSGLANQIDDFSEIFWIISNANGMDDPDIARLMQRLKTVHAAVVDGDANMEAHTLDVPYEARERMLEILKKDIYDDSGVVNLDLLRGGNKTATEIEVLFALQNMKADAIEYEVIKAVNGLLELLGVQLETEPTFTRSTITNQTELTASVMSTASVLPADIVIKHIPWLTSDEVEEALEELKYNDPLQEMQIEIEEE